MVPAQDADAVAFANTGAEESLRQGGGLLVQFLVGHRTGVVDDGRVVGVARGPDGQQAGGQEAPLDDSLEGLAGCDGAHRSQDARFEQGQCAFKKCAGGPDLVGKGGLGQLGGCCCVHFWVTLLGLVSTELASQGWFLWVGFSGAVSLGGISGVESLGWFCWGSSPDGSLVHHCPEL